MLAMDSKSIRFLARMGARGTLGQAVYDYACDGNDFFVVSADLAHASGFDRITKEFPEKYVNVGIAEQNMIGVAAGLASTGLPVIATSWAMFTSARVADQVRNLMGFMQKNVKLIGMDSGFMQSQFSYSHTNPPDIAIMRSIPGIVILSPCDGVEIYKAFVAAMEYPGPVYLRLSGDTLMPIVHKNTDFEFQIGKSITLREGEKIAIVATGNIVKEALDAAELLSEYGLNVRVIDMHTIVPLDTEVLEELLWYELVVTVEEHLKHGGLGSAVAEYYAIQKEKPIHLILGVEQFYPKTGAPRYVAEACGLTSEEIVNKILKVKEI